MTPALLAIDTAAPRLQLGLLRPDETADVLVEDLAQGHAELIFPRIAGLLERNALAYGALGRLAVTTGPGSFTGLRIGLAAAKGLGLALGVPVLGIPSLWALSLAGPGEPFSVLLDARRGEAYLQHFAGPGRPLSPPALLPLEAARDQCADGRPVLGTPFVDIARLARAAATLEPGEFPAEAAYVRGPDAKPQDKARIPRREGA